MLPSFDRALARRSGLVETHPAPQDLGRLAPKLLQELQIELTSIDISSNFFPQADREFS